MKRSITLWQLISLATISIGGVILHYLYDWTHSKIVAPFSGINESTWEHMKLFFFPAFTIAIIEYFFLKDCENYWHAKTAGILTGLLLIPVIYYTYNGSFGKSPDWFNISIFYIAAIASTILETRILRSQRQVRIYSLLCFVLLCIIGAFFVIFTFNPPNLPLFL